MINREKNKKSKYYVLVVLAIAILAVLVLPNLIISSIQEITKDVTQPLDSDQITYIIKEINSVDATSDDGDIEIHATQISGFAYAPGRIFYCIQHGTMFWPRNPGPSITVATAQKYGSIDSSAIKFEWPKVHGKHRIRSYEGENTYPYLRCTGDHYNLVATGGNYLPESGYIMTYPDMYVNTEEKQNAIWATPLNMGNKEAENALYYEAVHYREFHDQTTNYGQNYTNPDIQIKDETEKEKVTIKASYKEQTITVGPFSIDYINGAYEDVAFGGISDMYMIGYNSEDQMVKERIDIKKYIDPDGIGYELEYFEPNEDDKSFVDYSKQVYPKGKSAGEDTFQVQIENPNADLSADADPSEYVTKLKLHIEFKWMGVTEATICKMKAYHYTVRWKCDDTFHCHHVHDSSCYKRVNGKRRLRCKHVHSMMECYDCVAYSWLTATPEQIHANLLRGERKIFQAEIDIDADDKGFPITMDLGGKTWEDVPEGKESLTDGIYKEGTDRVLPNVKVTIYDEEGTLVNLKPTSEDETDAQIMASINPTYTDENGDYLFKRLDPLRKYYVTFEYNGQVYLPTDYEKNDEAYNQVDWFWTSKGTENSDERNGYDNTYFEIGSAPANYKVPSDSMQIAPLTNGYNESFSQYDLMGFKMTENGNYIQETRLIDGFYTIVGGEIKETEEFQEGEISKAIKEFIKANRKSPDENDMLSIYRSSARNDEELRKLQFIEDTKIESYTKAMNIITSEGSSRPDPDGTTTTTTIDRTKLLTEVENAMKQLRINYKYDATMQSGVIFFNTTMQQEFSNIRRDVSVPGADINNVDEVIAKFSAILKNMVQEDLRTDYINKYQLESNRYKLINYIKDSVANNYRTAWNKVGMYDENLNNFSFEIVYKNTGREAKANDFIFDDAVTITKTTRASNSRANTSRATTGSNSSAEGYDLYPIYDEFIINKTIDMTYDTAEEARSLEYDLTEETIDDVVYKPIYPGQFYINQGLWRRQEVDLALRKDVLYAATRINGKTEVYSYNKRDDYTEAQKAELRRLRQIYEQNGRKQSDYQAYLDKKAEFELTNEKGYWQIQLRMRDYNNYYSGNYTKELYEADYNYRSTATNKVGTDKDLQLYVTYKVTVRNASQSIVGEITELVDYYDRDYTYRDDLSWVMYKNSSNSNNLNEVNFTEADYYDTIDRLSLQGNISSQNKGTDSAARGRYERERSGDCRSDIVRYDGYQAVYIQGLEGKQLASGEEAYVYLTFEVNKTSGKIITDTDNSLKENYVEINGYKTYYENGTSLPNGVTKGRNDAAGLIDINSTPGNLCRADLQGNKYEKNFENDTDRAKSIKVVVREDFIRSINGTVWEDERQYNVSNTNAMIGDGIRQTGEIGVNGVTVELVERLENGDQYVWQETVSGSGTGRRRNVETGEWENYNYEFIDNGRGKYEFSKAITGNYFVRFRYGDTTRTANTDQNGGQNKTSYNGQDFKSTVYQKDMKTNTEIDGYSGYTGMTIDQYNGEYNGTSVGYYDIRQSDRLRESGSNFSDAKDLWNNATVKYVGGDEKTLIGRQQVMNYSNNNGNGVTNGLAEILASPYTTGNTDELIKNTQMTAVTGLIVLEGEYNRTDTDGYTNVNNGSEFYDNANNGNYVLNDVDFGLAERPKAQLELGKKITNVQIKLANGNILFDANRGMTDLMWTSGTPYELNKVGMKDINSKQYQEFYGLDNHRYTYRTEKGKAIASVNRLVADKYKNNGNNGLIVATMDEELMQGANITISYLLTVTNVGETDYYNVEQEKAFAQKGTGESFYYKGTGTSTIVRTRADVVTDYVANNLNFKEDAKNNNQDSTTNKQNGWKVTDNVLTTLGLNNNLSTKVSQYNDVIHTNNLNKDLAPTENTTVGLVLTQLINPENSTDDKTYDNIAEITTISNSVGRRMAYSIQGNQDPTATPAEVDTVKSERVTILPPFGIGNIVVYIAIAVSVLVILAGGIILIKKKVLNK